MRQSASRPLRGDTADPPGPYFFLHYCTTLLHCQEPEASLALHLRTSTALRYLPHHVLRTCSIAPHLEPSELRM